MNHAIKSLQNPKAYRLSAFAFETSFLPEQDVQVLRETIFFQSNKALRAERLKLADLSRRRWRAFHIRIFMVVACLGIGHSMNDTRVQSLRQRSQRFVTLDEVLSYCLVVGFAGAHLKSFKAQTRKLEQSGQEMIAMISKVSGQMLHASGVSPRQAGTPWEYCSELRHVP